MQHIVCGPDMPLNIDKEKVLGMGGSALVLRGELVKSVSIGVAVVVMLNTCMYLCLATVSCSQSDG